MLSRRDRAVATALITLNILADTLFVGWLAQPGHLPSGPLLSHPAAAVGFAAFGLLIVLELVRMLQGVTLWVFTMRAKDPVPIAPPSGLRVAVLTTIVPGKEPLALVARTLAAMRHIRYDGLVDVWILDEGDDSEVKQVAARLGVHHFSRKGRPEYNQSAGEFKARTKAGNHNAWRAEHEQDYDVVAQMDPDHIPHPDFLIRTLGYFTDPDVAFVVAPQVYGNLHEGFVQHAAATQAYFFHGIIQRGGNGMEAPLLIGTNHLYRPSAWCQLGGYQDSIIEDHLTTIHVYTTVNPETGHRYRGVYTPNILAVGEAPSSWTDFFNQQKRWAYGIWEILLHHTPRLLPRLSRSQRVAVGLLQFFYPSVAVVWVLGNLLTIFTVTTGIATINVPGRTWLVLWGLTFASSLGLFLWLRRFNLVEHERREWGITGMAMLAATIPVYVVAAGTALLRRPLAYVVTAKGDLASPDRLRTFRAHLVWAALAAAALVVSFTVHRDALALDVWLTVTLLITLAPMTAHLVIRWQRQMAHVKRSYPEAPSALAAAVRVPPAQDVLRRATLRQRATIAAAAAVFIVGSLGVATALVQSRPPGTAGQLPPLAGSPMGPLGTAAPMAPPLVPPPAPGPLGPTARARQAETTHPMPAAVPPDAVRLVLANSPTGESASVPPPGAPAGDGAPTSRPTTPAPPAAAPPPIADATLRNAPGTPPTTTPPTTTTPPKPPSPPKPPLKGPSPSPGPTSPGPTSPPEPKPS